MIRLAAAALAAMLATGAAAQDGLTGQQVLTRCTSAEAADVNWCVGFIYGVGLVISDETTDKRYRACIPADLTAEIGRLAVVKRIEDNPALLPLPGHQAVWYVLLKEFGCP